eukprot:CAMPEP_0113669886 /NCGR_PEP_ID=MMETSP0038_2-20120614/4826_1 /TAXON_ID=2898 /ORGANISM="Cryptomonas paramecium" /LENGTH=78 /DNA_ID=CAMNT_0000585833 /DNA_START=131 /DNA_END=367 /DNA_ORIENTATION=- /assembly_acc=CAM_ASM_000170
MDGKLSKSDLIAKVKQEYEVQLMQDIYNTITAKCFNKCVSKPGERLAKDEQTCLAKCTDRFLESRNAVMESMLERGRS